MVPDMGLLNKLKNVLFEEEIEIPETETKVKEETKIKETPKKKEPVKMTFDSDDDILSDRELFKAEPTFNFPVFDENEFDSIKKEEKPVNHEKTMEIKTRVKTPSILDVERGRRNVREEKKKDYEYDYKEARKAREASLNTHHKFTPSPVISPVYGVLDKNYKKEDIIVKAEEKKTIDVDSVRKKAFGTLEDDIEKTLNTSTREFYHREKEPEKTLDELLKESAEDVIPVSEPKAETIPDYPSFNIEEESIEPEKEKEMEILDRPISKSVEEKLEDDTLENDLFDLIDSMYETREDGEEE